MSNTLRDRRGNVKSDPFDLRSPCFHCDHPTGYAVLTNGQDCVYCWACERYANYNRPKLESGKATTSTQTHPGIKPKQKARILAAHGHQCVNCGRSPAMHGVVLDIDHMIPVALAKTHGVYDELIESEWNLVPVCAECNRGKQADLGAVSIQLMYRVLRMKATKKDVE